MVMAACSTNPDVVDSAVVDSAVVDSAVVDSAVVDSAVAGVGSTSIPTFSSTEVEPTTTADVSTSTSTTTTTPPISYVFPFAGRNVGYSEGHAGYRAVDVFGCGAEVLAPTGGVIVATRTVDLWPGSDNNPAYRGGFYVSLVGDDEVRYYFAHLAEVLVEPSQRVSPGDRLGIMGATGNAAKTECHTHFGISWTCDGNEWMVRRGKVWPQAYLDAWRSGEQLSPVDEVRATRELEPTACAEALADPDAPLA
jgi:murein DD-endopeptidase MepM/ murein hydrolase activator NlpD